MDHNERLSFDVGDRRENRRGAYEILEIDHATHSMRVRYERDGKEATLATGMQRRILEHMASEKAAHAEREAAAAKKRASGLGRRFAGLVETDFKTDVTGTTWRSRDGLGGLVAAGLASRAATSFSSFPVWRWPVVYFSHLERYNMAAFDKGSRKAKLMVELDEAALHYGFYIERAGEPLGPEWDWPRFAAALTAQDEAVLEPIRRFEAERSGRLLARGSTGDKRFHFSTALEAGAQPLWDEAEPAALPLDERVQKVLGHPDGEWLEVYAIAAIPKAEAIAAGAGIADTVCDGLWALAEVYSAATDSPVPAGDRP